MFSARPLPDDVAAVRDERAPGALVLDCERDFESLPPAVTDALATRSEVEGVCPRARDPDWLPADAPDLLARLAGSDLVVGAPGDGSVAWTTQTTPPAVLVKPRVEGAPTDFVAFLVAEALVEAGAGLPETPLDFFDGRYRDLDDALDASPTATCHVAAALRDGYRALHTRGTFRGWDGERPRLHGAWVDAGERIAPRVAALADAVADGETDFADATELACAALKHDLDLPAPFDALDDPGFRDHGADYAVAWARRL